MLCLAQPDCAVQEGHWCSGTKAVVCVRFSFSVRYEGGRQKFLEEALGHLLEAKRTISVHRHWNPNSASPLNTFSRYWENPLAHYTPQFPACIYKMAVRPPFLAVSSLFEVVHHSLDRETPNKATQQSTLEPIFHVGSFTKTTVQIN